MTKSEQRKMRALELRLEECERHFEIANNAHVEVFTELYQTRATLRQVYELLLEGTMALNTLMRDDPAFMAVKGE